MILPPASPDSSTFRLAAPVEAIYAIDYIGNRSMRLYPATISPRPTVVLPDPLCKWWLAAK